MVPTYYAKLGGQNGRDAAHALVGKFMTNIFHSNACPETNEYAARLIGRVLHRRANYSAGTSQSTNYGVSLGESINSGSTASWGSSTGPNDQVTYNSSSGTSSGSGQNWGSTRGRSYSTSESSGYSETMDFLIEAAEFGRMLKTGGRPNANQVSGVWYQAGRRFAASGRNVLIETFRQ